MAAKKRRKKKNDSFSKLVVVTVTTFIATSVLFAACIAMITSNNKKPDKITPQVGSVPSQSDIIIGFDDDEEISSDEVSSEESSSKADEHSNFEGTWKKTDVYESDKATIKITEQNEDGFTFKFTIYSNGKSQSISGKAEFSKKNAAVYTKNKASITFERGSKYISVYHTGNNSTLGFDSTYAIDGKFTTGTPNYYQQEEANSYDANVYKSKAVTNALKKNLSSEDYDLFNRMMSEGLKSPIPYERTVDKNGNKVNVDAELDYVKYYANLSDLGEDMIFICSNNGLIYVLFYNSEEIIYYTNDAAYSKKMPKAFQAVADSKGIKPIYK